MIAAANLISRVDQIPSSDFLKTLRLMPYPGAVLMCPPDYFDVIDVKNPFMKDHRGKVDRAAARKEWESLRKCFQEIGVRVELIPPQPGSEDMVFAANQALVGLGEQNQKMCLLGKMKFPSRQKEVPFYAEGLRREGYEVHELTGNHLFEGGGDAIWHPGRALIWGGYGPRSSAEVYPQVASLFGCPVVLMELATERFYHLDTCFCPLDEGTVLVHMPALAKSAQDLVRSLFKNVIEVDEREASGSFACNATAFFGKHVVLQRGANKTIDRLRKLGFNTHPVETSEFIKSGGSVFCMKTAFF